MLIFFRIFDLNLRNFISFSEILTGVALGSKIFKCLYGKNGKNSKEKTMENGRGSNQFAHSPMLLKTVSKNILIDQVHKFEKSYFKEHL